MTSPCLGLVVTGAGGAENVRTRLVVPLVDDGWTVAVTMTPTAARWLADSRELARLEEVTGLPARWVPRLPDEAGPHPRADGYAVVPASANTVAKLALGIADNQALTAVTQALGTPGVPVVVFPRVNAAQARHPAWERHLDVLRAGGVRLVYGDDVWPLHEPGVAPGRELPWAAVLDVIRQEVGGS